MDTAYGPFRFFDLPSELRHKILRIVLVIDETIDLDYLNYRRIAPRLALFLASKRLHEEGFPIFYGGHTFRILPKNVNATSKAKPVLTRLPSHYRSAILSLELHLGPGWNNPPRSWVITDELGLEDATKVRSIKVFVECDPSHEVFKGFRVGKDFYTNFSGELLKGILSRLPILEEVQFGSYPSVSRGAPLMTRLVEEAQIKHKRVVWAQSIVEGIGLSKATAMKVT
ncbi:hypothetical protein MMC06_003894 [Schaereria dolodes]|nr:hypothetical protein [Schaereria dolodes]